MRRDRAPNPKRSREWRPLRRDGDRHPLDPAVRRPAGACPSPGRDPRLLRSRHPSSRSYRPSLSRHPELRNRAISLPNDLLNIFLWPRCRRWMIPARLRAVHGWLHATTSSAFSRSVRRPTNSTTAMAATARPSPPTSIATRLWWPARSERRGSGKVCSSNPPSSAVAIAGRGG